MSSGDLVRYERFEEHREKLNRLRRVRPIDSGAVEAPDDRQTVPVAAVAVRPIPARDASPRDFTD